MCVEPHCRKNGQGKGGRRGGGQGEREELGLHYEDYAACPKKQKGRARAVSLPRKRAKELRHCPARQVVITGKKNSTALTSR